MKLSEWLDFNDKLLTCDFQIVLSINGSVKTSDTIITTIVEKDVARKYFGDCIIWGISTQNCPNSNGCYIKLLLWEAMQEDE